MFLHHFIFLTGSYLYNLSAFFHFHLYQTVSLLISPLYPPLICASFISSSSSSDLFLSFVFNLPYFPSFMSPLSLNVSFIAFSYIHHYPIFPLFIYHSFPINFPSCCHLSIFLCPIFSSVFHSALSFVILFCPLFHFSLTYLYNSLLSFSPTRPHPPQPPPCNRISIAS